MAEAGAEVLPEGCVCARIVGRKEKREHEEEAASAGGADPHAEDEGQADAEFAVGDEEGDERGVGKDEAAEDGNHEGVGAFLEELVDPELEAAVKGELNAEHFVLGEDEEEDAYADAEEGEGTGVLFVGKL